MNAFTEQPALYRQPGGVGRRTAPLHRRIAPKQTEATEPSGSGGVDCRLSALKVLALTLLSEIESLDRGNTDNPSGLDLQVEVRRFEAELIRNALINTDGRQRRAARLLGMKVTTLNTKIRRYQIDIANGPHGSCRDPG